MTFFYCPPETGLNILHKDEDLIVLDKPHGLLSVPGKAEEHRDCLETRVQSEFPRARIIHRLDMDTSGILVMAMHIDSHRHLSKQFEVKTTQKTYIAIVDGIVEKDQGTVDLALRCDWPNRPLQMVDQEQGRKATTHWKVLERFEDATRLELTPITGRSHQLRVHCLSLGHPILGDRFYASGGAMMKSNRMCLHAHKLVLQHPRADEEISFRSEVPF